MITRSCGISTGTGYLVGDGYSGTSRIIDNIVKKEAGLLQKMYRKDVQIRFNHNRESGGAWVIDGNLNCSIGLGVSTRNRELFNMSREKIKKMPLDKYAKLAEVHNMIVYEVSVDINSTINQCDRTEAYPTSTMIFKDFTSLREAVCYLINNVKGLR